MKIRFTVKGEPVAKGRPRIAYNKNMKYPMMYSPTKTKDWEQMIGWTAQKYAPKELLDCPLKAEFLIYRLKPKSKSKKVLYPDTKPDLDNYEKAIMDALEGIIFTNDSRIVEKSSKKMWGDPPRIEITIETLEG